MNSTFRTQAVRDRQQRWLRDRRLSAMMSRRRPLRLPSRILAAIARCRSTADVPQHDFVTEVLIGPRYRPRGGSRGPQLFGAPEDGSRAAAGDILVVRRGSCRRRRKQQLTAKRRREMPDKVFDSHAAIKAAHAWGPISASPAPSERSMHREAWPADLFEQSRSAAPGIQPCILRSHCSRAERGQAAS